MSRPSQKQKVDKGRTTDEKAAFYEGREYVDFSMGAGARTANPEKLDEERIREKGREKSNQVRQREQVVGSLKAMCAQLRERYIHELERLCTLHSIDFATAQSYFVAVGGATNLHWSFQREIKYRNEMRSKTSGPNPTIKPDDPELQRMLVGMDMPVEQFICSSIIANARPAIKAGSSGYTTGGSTVLDWGRNVPTRQESRDYAKAKANAEKQGRPKPPTPVYKWLPVPAADMAKLAGCIAPFTEWCKHSLGDLKVAQNNNNSIGRPVKQHDGDAHVRPPEKPREKHRRAQELDTPLPQLQTKQVFNTGVNDHGMPWAHGSTAVDNGDDSKLNDELRAMQFMWDQLGKMASVGQWRASMDWLCQIVDMLQDSNAMVFRCDYAYETPDGSRFRNIELDKVSYMDEELQDLHHLIKESEGKPKFNVATGESFREYPVLSTYYKSFPYACLFDSRNGTVHVAIAVARKYYNPLYQKLKRILEHWHEAYMSQHGGFSPANVAVRQSIIDDIVFGVGHGRMLCEQPHHFAKDKSGRRVRPRWRWRRYRYGELDSDGGGTLPDTGYPFVAECCLEGSFEWLVWTNSWFWTKGEKGAWERLHKDDSGVFRSPGWMEGDDDPEDMQCYARFIPGSMMLDVRPLLSPMFAQARGRQEWEGQQKDNFIDAVLGPVPKKLSFPKPAEPESSQTTVIADSEPEPAEPPAIAMQRQQADALAAFQEQQRDDLAAFQEQQADDRRAS